MRKTIEIVLAAVLLVLTLAACTKEPDGPLEPPTSADTEIQGTGSKETNEPAEFQTGLTARLAEGGAFSEELEPLDTDILWSLYRLEEAGLSRDQLSDAAGLRSSGATCEETAVLRFTSEDAAKLGENALREYINGQIQANRDYRPAEIPKLEGAVIQQRGVSVLLLVANDLDAVQELLD